MQVPSQQLRPTLCEDTVTFWAQGPPSHSNRLTASLNMCSFVTQFHIRISINSTGTASLSVRKWKLRRQREHWFWQTCLMKQTVTASSSFLLGGGNSLCTVTDVTMPRTSKMLPLSKEILEPENVFCSWNELQTLPHAGYSIYYKTKIYVSMSSVSFLPDNFKETNNNKNQGLNTLKQLKPPPRPNKKKLLPTFTRTLCSN